LELLDVLLQSFEVDDDVDLPRFVHVWEPMVSHAAHTSLIDEERVQIAFLINRISVVDIVRASLCTARVRDGLVAMMRAAEGAEAQGIVCGAFTMLMRGSSAEERRVIVTCSVRDALLRTMLTPQGRITESVELHESAAFCVAELTSHADCTHVFTSRLVRDVLVAAALSAWDAVMRANVVRAINALVVSSAAAQKLFSTAAVCDGLAALARAARRDDARVAIATAVCNVVCGENVDGRRVFGCEGMRDAWLVLADAAHTEQERFWIARAALEITECDVGQRVYATDRVRDAVLALVHDGASARVSVNGARVLVNLSATEAGQRVLGTAAVRDALLALARGASDVSVRRAVRRVAANMLASADAGAARAFCTAGVRDMLLACEPAGNPVLAVATALVHVVQGNIDADGVFDVERVERALAELSRDAADDGAQFGVVAALVALVDRSAAGPCVRSVDAVRETLVAIAGAARCDDVRAVLAELMLRVADVPAGGGRVLGAADVRNAVLEMGRAAQGDAARAAVVRVVACAVALLGDAQRAYCGAATRDALFVMAHAACSDAVQALVVDAMLSIVSASAEGQRAFVTEGARDALAALAHAARGDEARLSLAALVGRLAGADVEARHVFGSASVRDALVAMVCATHSDAVRGGIAEAVCSICAGGGGVPAHVYCTLSVRSAWVALARRAGSMRVRRSVLAALQCVVESSAQARLFFSAAVVRDALADVLRRADSDDERRDVAAVMGGFAADNSIDDWRVFATAGERDALVAAAHAAGAEDARQSVSLAIAQMLRRGDAGGAQLFSTEPVHDALVAMASAAATDSTRRNVATAVRLLTAHAAGCIVLDTRALRDALAGLRLATSDRECCSLVDACVVALVRVRTRGVRRVHAQVRRVGVC
jgi:hypothetical protein